MYHHTRVLSVSSAQIGLTTSATPLTSPSTRIFAWYRLAASILLQCRTVGNHTNITYTTETILWCTRYTHYETTPDWDCHRVSLHSYSRLTASVFSSVQDSFQHMVN